MFVVGPCIKWSQNDTYQQQEEAYTFHVIITCVTRHNHLQSIFPFCGSVHDRLANTAQENFNLC